jgi:hypothetical protein
VVGGEAPGDVEREREEVSGLKEEGESSQSICHRSCDAAFPCGWASGASPLTGLGAENVQLRGVGVGRVRLAKFL